MNRRILEKVVVFSPEDRASVPQLHHDLCALMYKILDIYGVRICIIGDDRRKYYSFKAFFTHQSVDTILDIHETSEEGSIIINFLRDIVNEHVAKEFFNERCNFELLKRVRMCIENPSLIKQVLDRLNYLFPITSPYNQLYITKFGRIASDVDLMLTYRSASVIGLNISGYTVTDDCKAFLYYFREFLNDRFLSDEVPFVVTGSSRVDGEPITRSLVMKTESREKAIFRHRKPFSQVAINTQIQVSEEVLDNFGFTQHQFYDALSKWVEDVVFTYCGRIPNRCVLTNSDGTMSSYIWFSAEASVNICADDIVLCLCEELNKMGRVMNFVRFISLR